MSSSYAKASDGQGRSGWFLPSREATDGNSALIQVFGTFHSTPKSAAVDGAGVAVLAGKRSRLGAAHDVIGRIDLGLAVMIPEVPIVAPLLPADAQMLHIDIAVGEHLPNFSARHARH